MSGKPVIAVTSVYDNGNTFLHKDYSASVRLAGGVPLIVPYVAESELLDTICEIADGLLLSGGEDIDPNLYGEEPLPGLGTLTPERDRVEVLLTERFLAADKPIFAICRGMQLLNAVCGGTLLQDIASQRPNALQHRQLAPRDHLSHRVAVEAGSLLEQAAGSAQLRVNSFHHQAVKQVAPGFRVNAAAADGIVEGMESITHRFVLGVQWHPENLTGGDEAASRLFSAFIAACERKENGL
ncbi:gamma-glutamyl-gamma-aminobutyrate hydrolase family protein [Paenibacillus oryzisoli]|uniref:gamma-glutamyl-gamma-aminobutyrate hydrolase family protein n=1 Tax=Paenibacillus oryzisoli TaxID=1850517 RepID=UPI003D2D81B3